MSEETNEGGLSGLKKTLIGTLTTIITAGGVWLTTRLFGGEATDKEEVKTEVAAPAPAAAPVIINLSNNNTNQQKQSGGTHTVVKEVIIEKAAPTEAPAQKESW